MCHAAVTGCEITEYIVRHVQELNPGANNPWEVTQLDGTASQCPFLPWMAFEGNLQAILTSALCLSSPRPNSLQALLGKPTKQTNRQPVFFLQTPSLLQRGRTLPGTSAATAPIWNRPWPNLPSLSPEFLRKPWVVLTGVGDAEAMCPRVYGPPGVA